MSLPELLAPAGSPAALEAALEAGADAVYFGGARHNARIGAVNFGQEETKRAVTLAHAYGVKVYLTLNTLAYDRELPELLDDAREAYAAGVDALIVADLGVAAAIHRILPALALHASTQTSGHCTDAGRVFASLGFSRMVCAREMSLDDIRAFTAASPTEAEVFVHGALCVSHSGQCLFSSLVGGRSGNRGECAQPCRLPCRAGKGTLYPLSLKDLCLAEYVPELIGAGVSSLKLEGRMKSPEYVLAVTSVWRRLLDEKRAATPEEMSYLASIFSRGGFTDGYFTKNIGSAMLGVRSEEDKSATRALPPFTGMNKKLSLDMTAVIKADGPMTLTVRSGERSVTVAGDIPEPALRSPTECDTVRKCLTRLGGTPYEAGSFELALGEGLAVPVSRLNALRRDAVNALDAVHDRPAPLAFTPCPPSGKRQKSRTARFQNPGQIPPAAGEFFDIIYLPLAVYDGSVGGVILPPVIFDSERHDTELALSRAAALGAGHIMVGNAGHIPAARATGLTLHGDLRLNITNSETVAVLESLGLDDMILSPELTLPQIRDIRGNTGVVVYGRIPLMLLEKCVARELSDCKSCSAGKVTLTDRRGAAFPVLREAPHRNVIYNSLPTCMSDRAAELDRAGVISRHFIFTTESAREVAEVIEVFENKAPLPFAVRRI